MNLLDHFILQHCQISLLSGELLRVSRDGAMQDAKVEMNLTPRLMEMDSGDHLPSLPGERTTPMCRWCWLMIPVLHSKPE